jgi:NADPH:quinone reductase-like Zn-dependent oxidoreductase
MRAAAINRFGPPSLLELRQVPVPKPRPNEVLIAIDTAGVGIWDASIRDGSWRPAGRARFPLIPGVDGAGIVVAKGSRVTRFRLGDRVYAYEFGNPQGGFYAEYVVANARHVGRIPNALDLRQAGAAAVTGLTALQGIDRLRLRRGTSVLIFGASGAVGTLAVQFAVQQRARVIATATGRIATRVVQTLGPTQLIDARSAMVADELRRFSPDGIDAVLALAGGDDLERCVAFLRPGGRVVYPNGVEPAPRKRRGIRVESFDGVASPEAFARLNRYDSRRAFHAPIAAIYPLAKAADAHRRLERGKVVGRIVLQVSGRPRRA